MTRIRIFSGTLAAIASLGMSSGAWAQSTSDAELAKQLSNPVASLISVPLKFDYDSNIGAGDDGISRTWTIQPVIPISLNENWNLISRTIIPYSVNTNVPSGSGSTTGLRDVTQRSVNRRAPASGHAAGLGQPNEPIPNHETRSIQ
jgi:hypothetical protein